MLLLCRLRGWRLSKLAELRNAEYNRRSKRFLAFFGAREMHTIEPSQSRQPVESPSRGIFSYHFRGTTSFAPG